MEEHVAQQVGWHVLDGVEEGGPLLGIEGRSQEVDIHGVAAMAGCGRRLLCDFGQPGCCRGELDAAIRLDLAVRGEGLRGAMQGTPGGGGDRGLAEYLVWAFLPVAGRCVAEECLEVCDFFGRPRVAARAEVMKHVIDGAGLGYDVAGC